MQHTLYLDSRYGCSLDRREQSAPQTVSDRRPEAPLKWLSEELGITAGSGFGFAREALWPLEANHELSFCSVHRFLSRKAEVQGRPSGIG